MFYNIIFRKVLHFKKKLCNFVLCYVCARNYAPKQPNNPNINQITYKAMNAKHLFLTLTMLLANFTFAWSETITDVISFSAIDSEFGAAWQEADEDPDYHELDGYVPNSTSGVSYAGTVYYKSSTSSLSVRRNECISSTSSAGALKTVQVTWAASTGSGRGLKVYGKSTPYTGEETYKSSNLGSLLGTLTYDGENAVSTLNVSANNMQYICIIGLESNRTDFSQIAITWTVIPSYNINVGTFAKKQGAVTINGAAVLPGTTAAATAKANDTVTVTVTPKAGYYLQEYSFDDMIFDLACMGYVEEEETYTFKFLMPDKEVTLEFTFDEMPEKEDNVITVKYEDNVIEEGDVIEIQSGVPTTFTFTLKYNGTTDPEYNGTVEYEEGSAKVKVTEFTPDVEAGTGTITVVGYATGSTSFSMTSSSTPAVADAFVEVLLNVVPREVALIAEKGDKFYAMTNTITSDKAGAQEVIKVGENFYFNPEVASTSLLTWKVVTLNSKGKTFTIQSPTGKYLAIEYNALVLQSGKFTWYKDEGVFFDNGLVDEEDGKEYGIMFQESSSKFVGSTKYTSAGVKDYVIGKNFFPASTYSTSNSEAAIYDSRSLSVGKIGSFTIPFSVPEPFFKDRDNGAKFYTMSGKQVSGENLAGIILDEVTDSLVAGHSYIYECTGAAINLLFGATVMDTALVLPDDGFVGCLTEDGYINAKGKRVVDVPGGAGEYRYDGNYGIKNNKLSYVQAGATATISPYRAYIAAAELEVVEHPEPDKGRRILCNEGFEDIESIFDIVDAVEDLQVADLIDWNQPVYNVMGIQVGKGTTGVLIQNGQKFLSQ